MAWYTPAADAVKRLFRPTDINTPSSITAIAEWPIYGVTGWTIEQVQGAINQQEVGASLRVPESLHLMMSKNPMYRHGMGTRINALLNVNWEYEVPEGCPAWQAQELEDHLPNLWAGGIGPSALATSTKYRASMGVGPVNVTWTLSPSGRTWLPVLHSKEAGWLSYFPTEARYRFSARDGLHWINPDGREWLLFTETLSQYPHQDGIDRVLAGPLWVTESAWRLWYRYSVAHGSPQRKVKGPALQRETEDVRKFAQQAKDMVGGSVVFCPQYPNGISYDFDLVAAEFSTYETFPRMLDYFEKWCTLVWLGAVDNTQGGSQGSRARATEHAKVSLQYLGADCQLTQAPLSILMRRWAIVNKLDPARCPRLSPIWQPAANDKEEADVRFVNAQALDLITRGAAEIEKRGIGVDWRQLGRDHGLPLLDGPPTAAAKEALDQGAADKQLVQPAQAAALWRPRPKMIHVSSGSWAQRGAPWLAAA